MHDPQSLIQQWLELERADLSEDAEAALGRLLGGLPQPSPGARFADSVLARAGVARRALLARFFDHWAVRVVVAVAAVQAAVVLAGISRGLLLTVDANGAVGTANAVVNLLVAVGYRLADLWWLLGDVLAARDLATTVSAPALIPLLVLLSLSLLIGLLLFHRVAAAGQRWRFEEVR